MKSQRQRHRVLIVLGILGLLPVTWNACSQGPLGLSQQSEAVLTIGDGGGTGLTRAELAAKSGQILTASCASCHTATSGPAGVFNLTNTDHLISSGLIVVGKPAQSVIYQSINTGSMPPGGGMSTYDIAVIGEWIASLGPSGGPTPTPTPTPTPSSTPGATPTPAPVSFANLQSTILTPKCVGCHGGGAPSAGIDLSTYANVKTQVNLANPAMSKLYTSVTTGGMPKGAPALSSTDASKILSWIQNGAPNN